MKYLKKYTSNQEYNTNKDSVPVPNICYVKEGTIVDEVKWRDSDYFKYEYLTTTALTDGTITFTMYAALTVAYCTRVAYSLDNGQTWTSTNNVASTAVPVTVNVTAGQKVLWKGKATRYETTNSMGACTAKFSSTCDFNVSGNTMSMLYEDDFVDKVVFPTTHAFAGLFRNCTGLINAQNLSLPATTLTNYCYGCMFCGCTSLINTPKLKAKTVLTASYADMFQGCTSLEEVSTLYATTVGNYGYSYMFSGCTALKKIGEIKATTLSSTYAMQYMFNGCTSLVSAPKIQVSTITGYGCYYMFNGCTSLVDASNVIIGNLNGSYACFKMFMGCTKLIVPPEFTGTQVGQYGCANMFEGCTSLVTAPELPMTNFTNTYCYSYMFTGCTKLVNGPTTLPATTLTNYCYQYMFNGCTVLTGAPALPATTLATACYQYMFQNCKALVNAPALNATTLSTQCYMGMFTSCTALVTAPTLPAPTLVNNCYWSMFSGCTALKYITMLATSGFNATTCLRTFTYNITTTGGVFTMNSAAEWYERGQCGIPFRWSIQYEGNSTAAETYKNNLIATKTAAAPSNYLRMDILTSGAITFNIAKTVQTTDLAYVEYQINGTGEWQRVTNANNTAKSITASDLVAGDYVLWRGEKSVNFGRTATSDTVYCNFSVTDGCTFNVSGNPLSLLDPIMLSDNLVTYCQGYALANLFRGCVGLKSAANLHLHQDLIDNAYHKMFMGCTELTAGPQLPSTYCAAYQYQYMFSGCTKMTTGPTILPPTTIRNYGYFYMFQNCSALTTAPILPATTLSGSYCYRYMFTGCSSLNYIKAMFTTSPGTYCTGWVTGVASTGTFVKNSSATWTTTGTGGVPSGWTVQTAAS